MRAGRKLIVGFIVLGLLSVFGVQGAAATPERPPLGRWFGAEGGWTETACFGFGFGCPGFLAVAGFGGIVGAQETHKPHQDLDLVEREWPARTGNYLFMANAPGGTPAFAYLSTTASESGPVSPGTISFGFRIHNLPLQPVMIYRHTGIFPTQVPAITLTLSPDGRLLLSSGDTYVGASQPVERLAWHSVTITYGAQRKSAIKLYVDNQPIVAGSLTLAAPSGDVDLGILTPTNTPFTIGLDDFVESPAFDAPIHGARINYLMPLGERDAAWTKAYPVSECRDAAKNWQLVSEDQWIVVDIGGGRSISCNLGGSAVTTSENFVVDEYETEGIPSRHAASSRYHRNLRTQPSEEEVVLGVRLRARGITEGPPLPITAGYTFGHRMEEDEIVFDGGGTGGPQTRWGPTHPVRPDGGPWNRGMLKQLDLRLDSGPGLGSIPVRRSVFGIRLDYLWVPGR